MTSLRLFTRRFIIGLFILSCAVTLYAADKTDNNKSKDAARENILTGTVSVYTGLKNGTVYEYVLYDCYKVSELDWDLKNLYYIGASADCLIIDRIYINGSISLGINEEPGRMTDSDWNGGARIGYSTHTCRLDKALFTDLSAGYRFTLDMGLAITPLAGIKFIDIKMTGYNGHGDYSFPPYSVDFSGKVISYEQKYTIPKIGVHLQYLLDNYVLESWAEIGFMGICKDIDNHFTTDTDWYGTMYYVESYELGISAAYFYNQWIGLKIYASYLYIPVASGPLYTIDRTNGTRTDLINDEGVAMSVVDIGVAAIYRF